MQFVSETAQVELKCGRVQALCSNIHRPTSAQNAETSSASSAMMVSSSRVGWACRPDSRGLHLFTSRLNVSAFCGIGGAFRGCLGIIYEVLVYTVQSPYQMGTFAPCPFSLSQLVDSRKALVWRNLSVSKRCTFLFPTSRLIRPSISRKSIYEKQVARTNMSQSGTF